MSVRLVARVGLPQSPARRFMIGSFVAHLLVTTALVAVPSLRKKPRVFNDAIRVELIAGPPATKAPAPPRQAAAVPTPPKPEPEGMRVEPKPVQPSKKPPKKAEPKADPVPQVAEDTPPTPDPGALQPAVEDPAPGAVSGGGSSVAPMEGGDDAFAWYRASVTASLFSHWQRPFVSGLGQAVETRVVFDIQRDGTVRNLRVENSSGVPSLDRSALRAVSDAAPLPPLPATWKEPVLPAGFVFQLFPE